MNVVDSSGWLEYFGDGPNAKMFATPIVATADLLVPTISIYEVFKLVARQRDEASALQAVALMRQGAVIDLTERLAVTSAQLSISEGLAMADSIILATARAYGALLWTQDSDFANIAGVKYLARKSIH
ncbi:MAG: type II toxin-antitoxin system VapC family toxin [Candidatus Binataceae bacterium]